MDSEYLMLRSPVGSALCQALVEVIQKQPYDPITYLALWLRKYVENQKIIVRAHENQILLQQERDEAVNEARRRQAMLEEQEQFRIQAAEQLRLHQVGQQALAQIPSTLATLEEGFISTPAVGE